MNDHKKELNRKMMQEIPEGASKEETMRILAEKQAAATEMQALWKAEDQRSHAVTKWIDRANYVLLVVLLIAFSVGLVSKIREGGRAALTMWSGPFRTLGLILLLAAYAMRGNLKRK